jgi:Phosphoesterase family
VRRRLPRDARPLRAHHHGSPGRSRSHLGDLRRLADLGRLPDLRRVPVHPPKANQHAASGFLTAAAAGTLPNLSIVTTTAKNSQHNNYSMPRGDNWIGQAVQAVMNGPDWASTAIFITYDDCGCFYDHVTPPPGMGIRVPP